MARTPFRRRPSRPRKRKTKVQQFSAPRPKEPRPKTKDLRLIYKGLVSVERIRRLEAVKLAYQWYDQAMKYVISRGHLKGDAQQSLLRKAEGCRRKGSGTDMTEEQETFWLGGLRLYAKVCKVLNPPDVGKYIEEYNKRKLGLEARQLGWDQRFADVVAVLLSVLQPKNKHGHPLRIIVRQGEKPRQISPLQDALVYNLETAKHLQLVYKKEGILPLVGSEMQWLARAGALSRDEAGKFYFDAKRQAANMHSLVTELVKFSRSAEAPNRLVKRGPSVPLAAKGLTGKVSGPPTPRSPRVGARKGSLVGGRFKPGSNMATLYEIMEDQAWHTEPDLQGRLTSKLDSRLRALIVMGKASGDWLVERQGEKVKMVLEAKPNGEANEANEASGS